MRIHHSILTIILQLFTLREYIFIIFSRFLRKYLKNIRSCRREAALKPIVIVRFARAYVVDVSPTIA